MYQLRTQKSFHHRTDSLSKKKTWLQTICNCPWPQNQGKKQVKLSGFCGRKIENGEERWSNQIHLSKTWLRSDIQPDSWKRSTTSSFQRLRTIPFQPHRWVPGGTGPIPPSTSHIAGLSQTTTVSFIAASKKRPDEKVCAVILKELKHEWTHVIHCITTSKHPCRTYGWSCMTFRSHYIDRMQKKRGTIGKIYCRRSHHGRKRLTGQTTDRKKKNEPQVAEVSHSKFTIFWVRCEQNSLLKHRKCFNMSTECLIACAQQTKQASKQASKQPNRKTNKQTNRQTDKQTDRQTNRQTTNPKQPKQQTMKPTKKSSCIKYDKKLYYSRNSTCKITELKKNKKTNQKIMKWNQEVKMTAVTRQRLGHDHNFTNMLS